MGVHTSFSHRGVYSPPKCPVDKQTTMSNSTTCFPAVASPLTPAPLSKTFVGYCGAISQGRGETESCRCSPDTDGSGRGGSAVGDADRRGCGRDPLQPRERLDEPNGDWSRVLEKPGAHGNRSGD